MKRRQAVNDFIKRQLRMRADQQIITRERAYFRGKYIIRYEKQEKDEKNRKTEKETKRFQKIVEKESRLADNNQGKGIFQGKYIIRYEKQEKDEKNRKRDKETKRFQRKRQREKIREKSRM